MNVYVKRYVRWGNLLAARRLITWADAHPGSLHTAFERHWLDIARQQVRLANERTGEA